MKVVAHRGASGTEPENTLRAVRKAFEVGADWVEVDVRVSRDGRFVVIHDETVDRTTDGSGRVSEMTFDELRKLDAGMGERIPSLEEVLDEAEGRGTLVLEVKVPGHEWRLMNLLRSLDAVDRVVVSSFYHKLVRNVKRLDPTVKAGVIVSSQPVNPSRVASEAWADMVFMKARYVEAWVVDDLHEAGIEVYPWVVDDVANAGRLVEMGVDGIVTNRPSVIRRFLEAVEYRGRGG